MISYHPSNISKKQWAKKKDRPGTTMLLYVRSPRNRTNGLWAHARQLPCLFSPVIGVRGWCDTVRNRRTWNPLETTISSRAHVAISLKKTRNVRNPTLVSCLSTGSSEEVIGGKTWGGGGSTYIALYNASYIFPACSLLNRPNVLRLRTAALFEKDSMPTMISDLNRLRSDRIVSSVITENSRNATNNNSWKRVTARVLGSGEVGWAESPSEPK